MRDFILGRTLSYAILALYTLRCGTYAINGRWGHALYWFFAFGITVSAEFLIPKWP